MLLNGLSRARLSESESTTTRLLRHRRLAEYFSIGGTAFRVLSSCLVSGSHFSLAHGRNCTVTGLTVLSPAYQNPDRRGRARETHGDKDDQE
jgi:hypothetical protein